MKNIAVLILIAAIAYYFLVHSSPFKQDFDFNGKTYSYSEKRSGRGIANHFYTPSGGEVGMSTSFIQIIEFSEDVPKDDWAVFFQPLYSRYNLKPFRKQEFELTGTVEKSGVVFESYAAPIYIKGTEHMAFYVITLTKGQNKRTTASQKVDTINKLLSIQIN